MNITATNKATGEVIELPANTPDEIVSAWRTAQEYDKAATALKEQLKSLVPSLIVGAGTTSDPIKGYQFRISNIQRMNYDKSAMRETLERDVYDTLVKPDKVRVDLYIKDNLEYLGERAEILRKTMLADGKPYQVVKLEKLERDDVN